MRVDKYTMAQSWMRQDDATPEEAKATWDTLEADFENNRKILLASAETDAIIQTINDKFGPGTMFPASEAPIPEMTDQQAIFEFGQRNPKAGGGRIGFATGSPGTDQKEFSKAWKDYNKSYRFSGPKGVKHRLSPSQFFQIWAKENMAEGGRAGYNDGQLVTPSGDGSRPGYQGPKGGKIGDYGKETGRFDTKQLQTAKYAKPYFKEALKTKDFTKIKVSTRPDRLKAGYKHTGGVFNSAQIKKFRDVLDNPYLLKLFTKEMGITEKQFRTVVEGGISGAVETKSVASSAKRIGTPSVKLQGQLFDEISNNPDATVKSMAKKFKKTEKEITKMSSRLLKNVYTQNVAILKGPEFALDNRGYSTLKKWLPSEYGTTKNFLNAFSRIDGLKKVQTENIGLLLQSAYKDKPALYSQALDNLAAYNKFRDNLPKEFKVDLDHPLSKAFLKGSGVSPDKLLYVTPIDRSFNRGFKEQLDKKFNRAMFGYTKPDGTFVKPDKQAVKNVRLLANKTGVNIGKVDGKRLVYGAKHLLEKRNWEKEYISNLKSQMKSAEKLKTLQSTEKGQKIIKDVFKGGKVKGIGDVDKIINQLTGGDPKLNKFVSQNFMPSGLSGAYEMLSDDLKKIVNSEGFKTWKAKIANPTLTAAGKAARLPTKFFGVADLALGYLDYSNNRQKGWSVKDSKAHMIDTLLFGITNKGEKADVAGVKKVAMEKYNISSEVFDQLVAANENQNEVKQIITDFAAQVKQAKNIVEQYRSIVPLDPILLKNQKDSQKRLKVLMAQAIEREPSLKTNLQVQEAGAPIDINVDKGKALGDLSKSSYDFVQKRIEDSDLEKIAMYDDTTMGGIGAATKMTIGDPEFWVNWSLNQPWKKTAAMTRFEGMHQLKKEDPQLYYKMLLSEGVDPHRNMNIPVHLEWEQKYGHKFGSPISDEIKKSQSYFDGGIASLRRKK